MVFDEVPAGWFCGFRPKTEERREFVVPGSCPGNSDCRPEVTADAEVCDGTAEAAVAVAAAAVVGAATAPPGGLEMDARPGPIDARLFTVDAEMGPSVVLLSVLMLS